MKLEIKELTSDKFDEQSKGVVILPHNYLSINIQKKKLKSLT